MWSSRLVYLMSISLCVCVYLLSVRVHICYHTEHMLLGEKCMDCDINRVATHLENLEKSGNSKVGREKSGKMEKFREKSGKLKFAFWTLNELKS